MAEVDCWIALGEPLGDGEAEHHADVLPQALDPIERAAGLRDPERRGESPAAGFRRSGACRAPGRRRARAVTIPAPHGTLPSAPSSYRANAGRWSRTAARSEPRPSLSASWGPRRPPAGAALRRASSVRRRDRSADKPRSTASSVARRAGKTTATAWSRSAGSAVAGRRRRSCGRVWGRASRHGRRHRKAASPGPACCNAVICVTAILQQFGLMPRWAVAHLPGPRWITGHLSRQKVDQNAFPLPERITQNVHLAEDGERCTSRGIWLRRGLRDGMPTISYECRLAP